MEVPMHSVAQVPAPQRDAVDSVYGVIAAAELSLAVCPSLGLTAAIRDARTDLTDPRCMDRLAWAWERAASAHEGGFGR